MLLPSLNIATGKEMGRVEVDIDRLPRRGDFFEIPHKSGPATVWRIDGVVWSGHPLMLKPAVLRLEPTT
jgi:hypothetical protein